MATSKSHRTSLLSLVLLGLLICGGCNSTSPVGPGGSAASDTGSIKARVISHGYPSIFQAWGNAQNLNQAPADPIKLSDKESALATMARHDLIWRDASAYGLVWNNRQNIGMSTGFTPESIQKGLAQRAQILALNPHAVLLAEIRYHDARSGYFPDDSPWWQRDASGKGVAKTRGTALSGYYMLDPTQPGMQDQIATLCAAAVDSGVVDGVMLDWWDDKPEHVAIAKKIREKIGDRGLIMGNVNGRLPTQSAPYINGMFMEGFGANFFSNWKTAVTNLQWASTHLRAPSFTAFEMWYPNSGTTAPTPNGQDDLARMRMATTISLCNSDGYLLYADNYHRHDWYSFWDPALGAPAEGAGRVNRDGSYGRNFKNGTAIFNPPDNKEVRVVFKAPVTRQSTRQVGTEFSIPPGDGEIFINSTSP